MKAGNVLGCLFGAAYGDAMGAPVEFIYTAWEIAGRYGDDGPDLPSHGRVTDDTQMMLAVGEALMATNPPFSPESVEAPLIEAFVRWRDSPDNDRAPGNTCLSACYGLGRGVPWREATITGSKGCGANMRVQPVGLLDIDSVTRSALAQFQAALTHAHPTALAASDLTAFAIARLLAGETPAQLPAVLRDYAESQRTTYHEEWLGNLWERAGESPESFIGRGWDECLGVLDRLDAALIVPDRETDPCHQTGAAWIAEEALATGLLCYLLFPDEPVKALQRATVTSGDSDSIACLTGAFAGASLGISAFPDEWRERIEYRERLDALGAFLVR